MEKVMFNYQHTFSSFSVDKLSKAKNFYGEILGIDIEEENDMGLSLRLNDGSSVFIYPKKNHQPATFTVLNFVVNNIDAAMESLKNQAIEFIHYENEHLPQDKKGILRGLKEDMGPDIAWFKDPAGNVLSILQEK